MGLSTQCVLVSGAHDQFAVALGAGACKAGDILIDTGTAWVVTAIDDEPDFSSGRAQSALLLRKGFPANRRTAEKLERTGQPAINHNHRPVVFLYEQNGAIITIAPFLLFLQTVFVFLGGKASGFFLTHWKNTADPVGPQREIYKC